MTNPINYGKKLGVAGCRGNTLDIIRNLIREGYRIDQIITVSPEDAESKYHISGYVDLAPYAEKYDIPIYYVDDYALRASACDKSAISDMNLDLLIAIGWQRIIPKWFLDILDIGAIGMHGAPKQPPYGRGHSVLNWSCIEGWEKFYAYLFFYRHKVDAGPIIGIQEFDISIFDTCETLHFKYLNSMLRLLVNHLPQVLTDGTNLKHQSNTGATYYPPRTPSDGLIEWNCPAKGVHNLVRGVTAPYPGAFTYLEGQKITIWRGHTFDTKLTWNRLPGTILEVFHNGKFLVQCRDYALLVHDYDGPTISSDDIGKCLSNRREND